MSQGHPEIPGNEHAFQQLTHVLASGKAIAFVGAGASAGLYPLWHQLIRQLADAAVERGMANDADRTFWLERCSTRPQQAVRGIKEALKEGSYHGLLKKMFGPIAGPDGRRFTGVHEALLKLPFCGYVTTNYDPGLLEARKTVRVDIPATGCGTWRNEGLVNRWITGDIFDDASCPVIFLHGSHDDADSIVLGAGEYRQAYQHGPFRGLLSKLWTQERLVFVGFGFSDAWMSYVADEFLTSVGSRASDEPRHIAILGLREDEQYTPQMRSAEQDDYNACLLTYPIRATEDGGQDHSALVQLLERAHQTVGQPKPKASKSPAPNKPVFPADYAAWLHRQCVDIDLVGMRLKEVRPVKLNHVYVPLTTPARQEADLATASKGRQKAKRRDGLEQEPKSELLLNRINEQSLYVSGPPGSGKSTFCRWLAWLTCTGELPSQREPQSDDYREQFPQALRGYLPILLPLRDFWKYLPEDAAEELSLVQLAQSFERWFADKRPGGLTWQTVEPHLDQGTALVIFDGVDEVPISHGDGDATRYPRSLLLSGLSEAVVAWTAGKGNRLLVTSRPYGLGDAERHKLGLPEARIEELPQPLQNLLVERWFQILTDDAVGGASLAEDMLTHVRQRPGINQLASNPMLLTSMCVIYREGKRLPQDKCDLYDRIVDSVLYNRVRDSARIEMVRNELRVVAHGMHTATAVGHERTNPEAEVDCQEVDAILESYQQQSRWTQPGFEGIVARREYLLSRTGLLVPRSNRRAAFYHFSIQEFLASERLSVAPLAELVELFRRRSEVPEWHNTLSFLFGTIQRTSVDRSVELVEQLLEGIAADQLGLQVVIGDALQMLLAKKIHLQPDQEEAYRQLCLSAIERETPLRERNLLGLALGHLGDPRIVTDLRDPAAYVKIPAGEYAYQDGKQPIDEPFLLSKYPVTNSQFASFIKDGGYKNRDLWSDEGWHWQEKQKHTEPSYWRNAKWNCPNQPVVGLSFYEAGAFCKWVGGFLPTEQQWEAAARGPEGLEYPWGSDWEDGICNSRKAGLGGTSPVGLFPRSRSRDFGLEEMAGNVWEWCNSPWSRGSKSRVLRGGSFLSVARYVRSAYRDVGDPDDRGFFYGFRVARTYT